MCSQIHSPATTYEKADCRLFTFYASTYSTPQFAELNIFKPFHFLSSYKIDDTLREIHFPVALLSLAITFQINGGKTHNRQYHSSGKR
jgi:hypothetical protein